MIRSATARFAVTITVMCLMLFLVGCATPAARAEIQFRGPGRSPILRDADLAAWRELIRPSRDELAFERIGWLPSFHEGLARANIERKPLLLWMMNGHPLGCT